MVVDAEETLSVQCVENASLVNLSRLDGKEETKECIHTRTNGV